MHLQPDFLLGKTVYRLEQRVLRQVPRRMLCQPLRRPRRPPAPTQQKGAIPVMRRVSQSGSRTRRREPTRANARRRGSRSRCEQGLAESPRMRGVLAALQDGGPPPRYFRRS